MADTTATERKARERARKRAAGLTRMDVWVPAEGQPAIRQLERDLQRAAGYHKDEA